MIGTIFTDNVVSNCLHLKVKKGCQMDQEYDYSLIDMVPGFPNVPEKEISRDSIVRFVSESFGPKCQKQLIACGPLSGKTNFIAQFTRYYENQVISYFINSNPLSQDLRTYLFVICNQMYRLLRKPSLREDISLEDLKSLFLSLSIKLTEEARIRNTSILTSNP